jgi:RimJ/RimL family protein N-acetyltransferase
MLETSRLKLVPLTHEQITLYKNNQVALALQLGVQYQELQNDPMVEKDHAEAVDFWITNTKINAEQFEWYTNWQIILKSENVIIGGIGFAGKPDAEGKSMVGYGLDIRYHGKGYATEALQEILKWAYQNELKFAVADTPIDHIQSHRVLIKNGFEEVGEDVELIHWKKA